MKNGRLQNDGRSEEKKRADVASWTDSSIYGLNRAVRQAQISSRMTNYLGDSKYLDLLIS